MTTGDVLDKRALLANDLSLFRLSKLVAIPIALGVGAREIVLQTLLFGHLRAPLIFGKLFDLSDLLKARLDRPLVIGAEEILQLSASRTRKALPHVFL